MASKTTKTLIVSSEDYFLQKAKTAFLKKYPQSLRYSAGTSLDVLLDRPLWGAPDGLLIEDPRDIPEKTYPKILALWDDIPLLVTMPTGRYKKVYEQGLQVKKLEAPKPWELGQFLSQEYLKAYGLDVPAKWLDIIIQNVGSDLSILMQDGYTLKCYLGSRSKVQPQDLQAVFSSHQETVPFPFVDAVLLRQATLALQWLDKLYDNPKDPTMLLVHFLRQGLERLYYIYDEKLQDYELFFAQEGIRAQPQKKSYTQALLVWHKEDVYQALKGLDLVEIGVRESKPTRAIFEYWIGSFLVRQGS